MEELALLAQTAGASVVSAITQKRHKVDPACYIGPGKARELAGTVSEQAADLVIFNDELSPSQMRNLEKLCGVKIIDRSGLILDIFARRARSREGKLQVELAQLQYLLPRLVGAGHILSRLGGGIGTRGPGETQLEVDRRVIRTRIGELRRQIAGLRRHRSLHRRRRSRNANTVAGLVGYTNAGKSTLLNALTGSDLYTEDKLFATLDPTVRRGQLDDGRVVLFTDTVGFIRYLPRQLVTAFQATLEEISAADILLHVVDLSHPEYLSQIEIVRNHLAAIDAEYHHREIVVFNKVDLSDPLGERDSYLQREFPGAVFISALRGNGLEKLRQAVALMIDNRYHRIRVYLPYRETSLFDQIRRSGNVLAVDYRPGYFAVDALVDPSIAGKLDHFTRPPADEKEDSSKSNPGEKE